jgi:hypothetical protein
VLKEGRKDGRTEGRKEGTICKEGRNDLQGRKERFARKEGAICKEGRKEGRSEGTTIALIFLLSFLSPSSFLPQAAL